MRELSHIITQNGSVTERHAATEQWGGDLILSSRSLNTDVLRPVEFVVPLDIRNWLSIVSPVRSAPPLTTDSLADQMRDIAQRLPVAEAVRLELIAAAVGQIERRVTLPVHVGGGARVIPISVERRV